MDTNIQNRAYLSKIMSIYNKQHLSNIEPQSIKKLSNTKDELKKKRYLYRSSAGSFLLRGQYLSKQGTFKGRLKQLHLEKDQDYNIRQKAR